MSQHDYNIANAPGATVRADLNNVLDAIATLNAGGAAPSVTFSHMWWMDTTNGILKQRNAANSAWVLVAQKDGSGWRPYWNGAQLDSVFLGLAGGTLTGALLAAAGSVGAPGLAFAGDADTGLYHIGADNFAASAGGGKVLDLSAERATLPASVALSGTISPAQLTADVNNYSPSGLSGASALRLTSDAERTITGLAGGAGGRLLTILNVGSQNIVLAHQSTSSTAANRFLFASGGNLTLAPEQAVTLRYDATTARWRRLQDAAVASAIEFFTPIATTTGTEHDLSVPSGRKVIRLMLNNVSTNGASPYILQLGTSGGIKTTSYLGGFDSAGKPNHAHGIGFLIADPSSSSGEASGIVFLTRMKPQSHIWMASSVLSDNAGARVGFQGGAVDLGAELTTIRLTTENATDTFDVGEIGGQYE